MNLGLVIMLSYIILLYVYLYGKIIEKIKEENKISSLQNFCVFSEKLLFLCLTEINVPEGSIFAKS